MTQIQDMIPDIQENRLNPNKALWEKGDFTRIATSMRASGEAFVHSLHVPSQARVLDLGCGDGTTAVPLAKLGAEVRGIDIASNLVAAARDRAIREKLPNLTFKEGDACNLEGIADHDFDLTISVFGAMFAPRPYDVAAEMVRVTRPGGRIVMGNWIPNDPTSFVSQVLRISSAYTPSPPAGFISPMTWGQELDILDRFGKAGILPEKITMTRDTYTFVSADSPSVFINNFRHFYGPTMNAFEAAAQNGKEEELYQKLLDLAVAENRATDGTTSIAASFMRVTVNL